MSGDYLPQAYAHDIKRAHMHLSTLPEWLTYIGSVHASEIDLGLDRVKKLLHN